MIYINGLLIEFERFPNGETHLKTNEFKQAIRLINKISFKYEDDGDLIKLMFVKKFLDEQNLDAHLQIYYMPYSRMDRKIEGSAFTLKYVADFINGLGFKNVVVVEPHSDVTTALLNKAVANNITLQLLNAVLKNINFNQTRDCLFFPDAGAQKRYHNIKGYQQLVGYKDRDLQTGDIKKLDIVGEVPYNPQKVLIIDDLSSYGGTFIKSAEKLRELGFKEIYLLVGHAENSIYKGDIFRTDLIKKVFTTNSIIKYYEDIEELGGHAAHDRLKVYKLEEIL